MSEEFTAETMDVMLVFPGLTKENRDEYQNKLMTGLWEMLHKHFPEDVEAMTGKKFQFIIK